MQQATQFINVDLDVYSRLNLEPLVSALGAKVSVLSAGRVKRTYYAHMEVARATKSADAAIRVFCSMLQSLPKAERLLWNAAKRRDFNIGIQAGTSPFSNEFAIESETVQLVAQLNARIIFTIYAPR